MQRSRITSVLVALLVLFVFASSASAEVYLGKVKSALEGKLVMTESDGNNERTFTPDRNTRITLNGERVKLDKLVPGNDVTVKTEDKAGKTIVLSIEAQAPDELNSDASRR